MYRADVRNAARITRRRYRESHMHLGMMHEIRREQDVPTRTRFAVFDMFIADEYLQEYLAHILACLAIRHVDIYPVSLHTP